MDLRSKWDFCGISHRSLSKTPVPTTDTMSADEHMKDESVDESVAMTSSEPTADESATTDSAVMVEPRKWWTSDIIEDKGSNHRNCSRSGWDFSSILFPDLGSKENLSGSLASPDPSLLPGALAVGVCDVASWRSKINQRKVKGSPEHGRRGVDNQRQGWHGKKDKEVCCVTISMRRYLWLLKYYLENNCVDVLQGAVVQKLDGV